MQTEYSDPGVGIPTLLASAKWRGELANMAGPGWGLHVLTLLIAVV